MKDLCKIQDCIKPKRTLGMCIAHYGRFRLGKELDTPLALSRNTYTECQFKGCDKPHLSKGYCYNHYRRFKAGKPLDTPIREAKKTPIEITCEYCGKKKLVQPSWTWRHCSRTCAGKAKLGKSNNNWQGGITKINAKQRNEFGRELRKKVMERDNYICQICNESKSGYMQVDHIKPWRSHPELRFDINNCRTLCMWCHYEVTFGKKLGDGKYWGRTIAIYRNNKTLSYTKENS